MKYNVEYIEARDLLVSMAEPADAEYVDLETAVIEGRILAQELIATENVPAFDRSPYDGYAFIASDTKNVSRDNPVTLKIIEEIPAGSVATKEITHGTASKILTGAPIPPGADAVIMYEKTRFTKDEVTIFSPSESGDNIVKTGEDVKKGTLLCESGMVIDPGLAATIAAQGISKPKVYRKVRAALISTGSELIDLDFNGHKRGFNLAEAVNGMSGKIYNSNRYSLAAALTLDGVESVYLGTAGDSVDEIETLIRKGIAEYDMVVLTGGVSAGDYDLTPDAMEKAGCELLIKAVNIKPGMACCFGMKDRKAVYALSGNPSSSLINYYAVVRPAVRKLTGLKDYMPEEFKVVLKSSFKKKTKVTRFLKGRLKIEDGKAVMYLPEGQGNVVISSSIGCDIMAVVPKGTGPLEEGTELTAFKVR